MTVASTKRLFKITLSLLRLGFNSSKCKTAAKMAVARIKLLRNKREVVVRQMRRDIALLLQSGQDATARIRVEHVMREQNVLAANEFIELFCELVVARLAIISKQKECPADLKEGIASLIFAAPRCSEIPELVALKNIFEKKYGKDFVSAAVDLRPSCGVNRQLIEKLSVRTPPGEVKLKVLKEIAKEHHIDWDTTDSEKELLKPPEELIVGPSAFVSASSLPVKPSTVMSVDSNKPATRLSRGGKPDAEHYKDSKSAAEAAAEAAKQAIAAAEVAAYMAMKDYNNEAPQPYAYNDKLYNSGVNSGTFQSNNPAKCTLNMTPKSLTEEKMYRSQSLPRSDHMNNEEDALPNHYGGNDYRRHSYHPASAHSDIKFDESSCDEEIEAEEPPPVTMPPNRLPPPVPSSLAKQESHIRVHPKLPDYDELAARFDALKFKKSQS
ncbi:IST1-like protein [Glycine soja]